MDAGLIYHRRRYSDYTVIAFQIDVNSDARAARSNLEAKAIGNLMSCAIIM